MKKIISLILAVMLCVSSLCFSVPVSGGAAYRMGDLNADGKINAKDSLLMRKIILLGEADAIYEAADINGDGEVTAVDSLLLRKHLAKQYEIDPTPVTDRYLASISIYGISIEEYDIVIPEGADTMTAYAAELLADYVNDKSGIKLDIEDDASAVEPYEILIGATNREESIEAAADCVLAADEYVLKADGYKVVMLGNSYMIGGGVGKFTHDYVTYDADKTAQNCDIYNLPVDGTPFKYEARDVNNAILMIGDGMGHNHITGTLFNNANTNRCPEYTEFFARRLPVIGQVKTESVTTQQSGGTTPTDSAAAATALATGVKTLNGYLGLDKNGNRLLNIREASAAIGKKTGVMTTEIKEGATPSGFTVHINSRKLYDEIALQQDALTDIDILKGEMNDNIPEDTKNALDTLSTNNENGFFIMIEESHTDTYAHLKDRGGVLLAMNRFNKAIGYAMVFAAANPDTLLIITADHETGGMNERGGFTTDTHTTVNVPIFSIGGGSENFAGIIDNTLIPKVIAREFGIENFGS
ncbi:MAG: hypothetical protein E7660_06610 [Ruminococcaceae bacterium]|nr:hypothetical protein [Oscillospiraceae bacterium]